MAPNLNPNTTTTTTTTTTTLPALWVTLLAVSNTMPHSFSWHAPQHTPYEEGEGVEGEVVRTPLTELQVSVPFYSTPRPGIGG